MNSWKYSTTRARHILCVVCISIIIFSLGSQDISGEAGIPLREKSKGNYLLKEVDFDMQLISNISYLDAKKDYSKKGLRTVPGFETTIRADQISASPGGVVTLKTGIGGKEEPVLVWNSETEWIEWDIEVPEEGLYEISLEYYPLEGSGNDIVRELSINGKVPFLEAGSITLTRLWRDEGEIEINSVGDEVRPRPVEIKEWITTCLYDSYGKDSRPLLFHLNAGTNKMRLKYLDQPMAIGRITVKSGEEIPPYEEVLAGYKEKNLAGTVKSIEFQAESDVIYKSHSTIRMESDGDPMTEPLSMGYRVLNCIGGERWRKGNQYITWKFFVPEEGLYKIGLRFRQNYGDGLPSFRSILIDGKVPFLELCEYKFEYGLGWRTEELKDDRGIPFLFHLEEGEHTLTMRVVLGPAGEIADAITKDLGILNRTIRNIIMITSRSPDQNYDYELDKKIPGLVNDLKALSGSMQRKIDVLTDISAKRPSVANTFESIKYQLDAMISDPFIIARKLGDLESAQTTLASWYRSIQEQPLLVDYFLVGPHGEKWKGGKSTFLQKLKSVWINFVVSFKKDYTLVGKANNAQTDINDVIDVWTSRGKEWAELMKKLIDEDFTPKTGIAVNVNVLPPSQLNAGAVNVLMLAILSGNAPDVGLGVSSGSPVEFAIRNTVANLACFPDYDIVEKRFLPGIMIPFRYRGGVYALPETMNFKVLFYRKDILKDLGLGVPDTWEDVYSRVLPVFYRNNMDFTPASFATFLFQHGGSFYTKDESRSGLDTPEAYMAFKEWIEQYTQYKMPVSFSTFNRFRIGDMPMCIGDFSLYVMLSVAAPELLGRWGIAVLPGSPDEDGTVDRTTDGASGECAIILQQSEKKEQAWAFLKWWTDYETQTAFGREIEAIMGPEARWNTSNYKAFEALPWKQQDLMVIREQWQWMKEIPVVVGGYFTGRHLNNAFTRVLMGGENIRDSLEEAVKEINKEMIIKREEYGLEIPD